MLHLYYVLIMVSLIVHCNPVQCRTGDVQETACFENRFPCNVNRIPLMRAGFPCDNAGFPCENVRTGNTSFHYRDHAVQSMPDEIL